MTGKTGLPRFGAQNSATLTHAVAVMSFKRCIKMPSKHQPYREGPPITKPKLEHPPECKPAIDHLGNCTAVGMTGQVLRTMIEKSVAPNERSCLKH